jgi:hypothetical protein
MKLNIFLAFLLLLTSCADSQKYIYPFPAKKGYVIKYNGKEYVYNPSFLFSIDKIKELPSKDGIIVDFNNKNLNGSVAYGFINYNDKYAQPVYFKKVAPVKAGKVLIPIANLSGKYDMIGWETKHYGTIGYRLIDDKGNLLYDSRIGFRYKKGQFIPDIYIKELPSVNIVTPNAVTIRFKSNVNTLAFIKINGKEYQTQGILHEKKIEGLSPDTRYSYTVICGIDTLKFSFRTALPKGSKKEFSFAYASDSRAGQGGGERNLYGTNAYILKKIFALAKSYDVSFLQFSGDLINGYTGSYEEMKLEYSNWHSVVMPFTSYFPVYTTMGNHEVYNAIYKVEGFEKPLFLNYSDLKGRTGETIFAEEFTNPENSPEKENYKNPANGKDLPPYSETVYYYVYGNMAMIVLNADYFYNPSLTSDKSFTGNLHAYIMDAQMEWLRKTISMFEKDNSIDYIFLSMHTPLFPNGGHSKDDMWYGANNSYRPQIGKKIDKGIIERRDEILDLIVNKSKKVKAVFTGDEHNYCRLEIGPGTNIYPDNWQGKKIKLTRTIWQINNGAAGAPYYAKEQLPWTQNVKVFSTENALVLVYVNKDGKIFVRVVNPDTLNIIDEFYL